MKQELMDAIQETPVIAAVKDDAGLCNALTNENIRVVFVLYGDICNIASIVRRIHEAGRFAAVHVDLIAGLAGKEVAVDFIRNTTEATASSPPGSPSSAVPRSLGWPPFCGYSCWIPSHWKAWIRFRQICRTVWTCCPAPCPRSCAGCALPPKCRCSPAALLLIKRT